jgi:hypothetical protein
MRHFYTPQEQEKLIRHWQKPASMKDAGLQTGGQEENLNFVGFQSLSGS